MKKKTLLISIILISTFLCFAQMELPFTSYDNNPVFGAGNPGEWDDGGIFSIFTFEYEGEIYIFYTGSNDLGIDPGYFGYAKSSDGYNFNKSQDNPIFGPDGSGFDAWSVSEPVLRYENETWILYYSGDALSSGFGPGLGIGRATASDLSGTWNRMDDPILEAGVTGEWDSYFISPLTVIKDDNGTYIMYYSSSINWFPNGPFQIGMATSPDGIVWTKYDDPDTQNPPYADSDPVLKVGSAGSWDDIAAWYGSVQKTATGYEMFYSCTSTSGDDAIGYAKSSDGIAWSKNTGPIYSWFDDPYALYNGYALVEGPHVLIIDSQYFMYYDYGWPVGEIGLATAPALSQIINVPGDQPTIQAAIDIATHGDSILVSEGTYYENINFKGKAITVTSHYINDPDTNYIYNTIIDGGQPANPDSASVVSFISGEDTTSVLCGFTIQNGTGTYIPSWEAKMGGGILNFNAGAMIIHNRIINNQLTDDYRAWGGGIVCFDITTNSFVVIKSNIIANNTTENSSNYPGGSLGAGIYIAGINNIIENNQIISNTANGRPYGAGMIASYCLSKVANNVISNNMGYVSTDNGRGAGVYFENCLSGTSITDNVITNNHLNLISGFTNGGGGIAVLNVDDIYYNEILFEGNIVQNNFARSGGGIYLKQAYNSIISNNVIQSNDADFIGGGILYTLASKSIENEGCGLKLSSKNHTNSTKEKDLYPVLNNNTISDNNANSFGGGITSNMSIDFIAFNNIIYDNTALSQGNEIYLYNGCNVFLNNNNIDTNEIIGAGNWEGANNIYADPLFEADGYHITPGSPCIEEGITSIEIDEVIYYCPDYDIDGQERPLNATADIGADEVLITEISENIIAENDQLLQISPNPFTGITHLRFTIEEQGFTICDLYEISGVKVKRILNEEKTPGTYEMEIDLSDLPKGIYFITIKTNKGMQTKKLIKL